MKTFKQILCPLDFSEFSLLALRYAVAMAKENESNLILFHAVPDIDRTVTYMELAYPIVPVEKLQHMAAEQLDSVLDQIEPVKVPVNKIVGFGDPSVEILRLIQQKNVDLVVMGTHGRAGFERFLLGSVTAKVLHKAMIPALTVCKPTHHFMKDKGIRPVEIKRILCPVDLNRGSESITELALSLAKLYQSELTMLHVANKKEGDWFERESSGIKKMKVLVNPDQEWCKVRYMIENGRPDEEILKVVEREGIDLIVMGHHSHLPAQEVVMGSVALKTIAGAACPVLVLRS